MHCKALGWGVLLYSCVAAGLTAASISERLHDDYVSGLKVISLAQASQERAAGVLSLVNSEAQNQAERLTGMEHKLAEIHDTLSYLDEACAREVTEGKRLLDSRAHLQARLTTVDTALKDLPALLAGATQTGNALMTAADKSGRLAERRFADQFAVSLKNAAEKLQRSVIEQSQLQISLQLELTLLDGLQSKAAKNREDVNAGKAEEQLLAKQIATQRTATDVLTKQLQSAGERLIKNQESIAHEIEDFRLVQVAVLRRWLLEGPPAGDLPELTISDVMEGGYSKKPSRPDPSSTLMGQGLARREGVVASDASITGKEETDLTEATADFIALSKRSRWYLSLLERTTRFIDETFGEAESWRNEAENWRGELTTQGTRLATERGGLTSLHLEQDVISATVALIAEQTKTAHEQVEKSSSEVATYALQLRDLTTRLDQLAKTKP